MNAFLQLIKDKFQDSSIAKAVLWSMGSKLSGALLQLAALPLAARSMGPELYGVYLAITSVLSLLGTFNLGVGPSMTKELSYAIEHNNPQLKKEVFSTSVFQGFGFVIVIYLVGVLLATIFPMSTVFGPKIEMYQVEAKQAFLVALAVASLSVLISIVDGAQTAELEIYKTNRAACFGVLLSALAIIYAFHYAKVAASATTLVILIYGLPLIPRIVNCGFFLVSYDAAKVRLEDFSNSFFWRSLKTNSKFTVMQIGAFVFDSFGLIWIAKIYGFAEAAKAGILIQLSISVFGSVVMMVLQPAWPILARNFASNNMNAYSTMVKRLYLFTLAYSILVFLGFLFLGSIIIGKMYGAKLVPGEAVIAAIAGYYLLNRIDTVGFFTLVASDADDPAMYGILAKAALGLLSAFLLAKFVGPQFFYAGMFIGTALTTVWYYYLSIGKIVRTRRELVTV